MSLEGQEADIVIASVAHPMEVASVAHPMEAAAVAHPMEAASVVHPMEAACVKHEPQWDSDDATCELNKEKELGPVALKEELELGPVVLQPPDAVYAFQEALQKEEQTDCRTEAVPHRACSVVLEPVLVDMELGVCKIGTQIYKLGSCLENDVSQSDEEFNSSEKFGKALQKEEQTDCRTQAVPHRACSVVLEPVLVDMELGVCKIGNQIYKLGSCLENDVSQSDEEFNSSEKFGKSYDEANYYIMANRTDASIRNGTLAAMTTIDDDSDKISSKLKLKRIKKSKPQSKNNGKKIKVVDKARFVNQVPSTSQQHSTSNVPSQNIMADPANERSYPLREQSCESYNYSSRNQLPSHEHFLHRYPRFLGTPENFNKIQAFNNRGNGSQGAARNVLHASRNPLILKDEILRACLQSNDNLYFYRDYLRPRTLPEETKRINILNSQTCYPGAPFPQPQVQDFRASNQVPILPVYQDHPQVSSTQTIPRPSSEAESIKHTPTYHSGKVSVGCSRSVEHQDIGIQAMVVDESTEAATTSSLNNADQSTQPVGSLIEEGPPTIDKITTYEVPWAEDVDVDDRSSSPEMNAENLPNAIENSVEEPDQTAQSMPLMADRWVARLADIFKEMDCDFTHACEVTAELHKSFVQSSKVVKRLKEISENFRNQREKKSTVVPPKEGVVEDQKVGEVNQAEMTEKESPDENMNDDEKEDGDEKSKKSEDDCNDNDNDDESDDDDDDNDSDGKSGKNEKEEENKNPPKKIRGNIRSFVLPPEYDANDTRWTLKHRELSKKLGLVELVPRSKVYINSIRLSHCKRVSKDSKTLARMLLVEIFTQRALSVCSLTGARANAFDISGTHVRPGLDEHARMVIMSYVEDHAREKNWGPFDSQSVINSVRSKIQEIRAKFGQTA